MKMQRNNGFLVPAHNWIGFRARNNISCGSIEQPFTVPKGSNLEGVEPIKGGGVRVRWKGNIVLDLHKRALQPLTRAAREFLKVCS